MPVRSGTRISKPPLTDWKWYKAERQLNSYQQTWYLLSCFWHVSTPAMKFSWKAKEKSMPLYAVQDRAWPHSHISRQDHLIKRTGHTESFVIPFCKSDYRKEMFFPLGLEQATARHCVSGLVTWGFQDSSGCSLPNFYALFLTFHYMQCLFST